MSSVDDRIVNMQFNNSQFQKGVADTNKSLEDLNTKLKLPTGTAGLEGIANGIQGIASKFSALSIAGVTALATIASKAVDAGIELVKSLTVEPVTEGLASYNQQIAATQTILANTSASGATLQKVTGVLDQLQTYAQQTVYSFTDMTTNIGRFTAAGVGLSDATDAIKGMGNMAALSGADTQQLGSAMYQMSQALATGTIRLQDWNSLNNAQLGTSNMQKALEETARTMGDNGKAMDAAMKKQGNFRDSLQEGWLTTGIFTKAMKVMGGTVDKATGEFRPFTVAEIKAMGYTDAAAKSLAALSKNALDSATKIRTIPQMMQALGEEVAGSWSKVFKAVIGDLNQSTELFTGLHNVLENMFTTPVNNLASYIGLWDKLGGRTKIIDQVKKSFTAFQAVFGRVKNVFEQVFPPDAGQGLLAFTNGFVKLMQALTPGAATAGKIALIFKGIFSLFDIGMQIIKGLATVFGDLFGVTLKSSGGILDIAAKLGQWIFEVDQALKNGGKLQDFFKVLGSVVKIPIQILGNFITLIVTGFGHLQDIKWDGFTSGLGRVNDKLAEFRKAGAEIAKIWGPIGDFFQLVWSKVQPVLGKIGDAFKTLGKGIAQGVTSGSFKPILDAINTGLFGAITLLVARFYKKGFKGEFSLDLTGGVLGQIKETFETLTSSLKKMIDAKIKTDVIKQIAVAVALLSASAVALSLVDSKRLAAAMGAITLMVGNLAAGLALLNKIDVGKSSAKLPVLAASLILFAAAIDILSIAVTALSKISWEGLAKGMSALTVILGEIVGFSKLMGPTKGIMSSALAITAIAVAVNILAGAIAIMSTMSWESIGKGMAGVAAGLLAMVLALNLMPKSPLLVLTAAAMVLVGVAIAELAGAMKVVSTISWNGIGKGMTVLAGGLVLIVAALAALSYTTGGVGAVVSAAAILIVSTAIVALTGALKIAGSMSWVAIAKSMVVLAGSLTILAAAMIAMLPALPGAVALTVISAALAIFVPILALLGKMSWDTIGSGLGALAAAMAVLAISGVALLPAIPGLMGLGVAIALIGAGAALAGVGMIGIAAGLTAIGAAGPLAIDGIQKLVLGIINLIPQAAAAFASGLITFLTTMANNVGTMVDAMSKLLGGIITAINNNAPGIIAMLDKMLNDLIARMSLDIPKWADEGVQMMVALLGAINNNMPQLVTAGVNVIVSFINGVAKNINKIITAGTNLIISFIRGIGGNAQRLATAAAQTILQFINGLTDAVNRYAPQIRAAGLRLAGALVDGMTGGLASKAANVAQSAFSLGKKAIDAIANAVDSHSPSKKSYKIGGFVGDGLTGGIDASGKDVESSAGNLGTRAVKALKKAVSGISKVVDENVNLSPTITPVLDLSGVRNQSGQISNMITPAPLSVTAQYATASGISNQQAAQQVSTDSDGQQIGSTNITFNQTIQSPKAVPEAEVYRNTNNMISTAKGELAKK